jgi:hypothetical protein
MQGNCSGDSIVFCIDDGQGSLSGFGSGVDDIDFVAGGTGGDGDGVLADDDFTIKSEIHNVKNSDSAAKSVTDIYKFAIVGWVLGEVVVVACS